MADRKFIKIRGAREHNLKNIDLDIPRQQLSVITGLSGSGKSSLAFDTIYAEGQRRYVESLSSYARMFLGQLEKPDVDSIEGLSPAISIDQKSTVVNPRSTVGTVTEIYDYFRLLYARVGVPYCPNCGKPIKSMSIDQIIDKINTYPEGSRLIVTAPVVRGKKGEFAKQLESYRKSGYIRVKIDGEDYELDEEIKLDKNKKHEISVVIDRLVLREDNRTRMYDSCETALKLAEGLLSVDIGVKNDTGYDYVNEFFSQNLSCPDCGLSFGEVTPRSFSFNNAYGACPHCSGIGTITSVDPDLCVTDPNLSLNEGAVRTAGWNFDDPKSWGRGFIVALSKKYGFSLDTPYKKLPQKIKDIILYGNNGEKMKIDTSNSVYSRKEDYYTDWEGVVPSVWRRYQMSGKDGGDYSSYEKYLSIDICPECQGKRLKKESLSVLIDNKNISDLCDMSVKRMRAFFEGLEFASRDAEIAAPILREIKARLEFLNDVGLEYMTLSRATATLSGGEAQRIRLATQIGSGLQGVLYILDEPSIGLHQRDNDKLLKTLYKLRDLGNTVLVVEHDEDTMRAADYIVDIGPGAGEYGGQVIACGTVNDIIKEEGSITGSYLGGKKFIPVPINRRKPGKNVLKIKGASVNNLKNIDVDIPLGLFNCITGVSGSGKSSLINSTLVPFLSHKLNGARKTRIKCDSITGYSALDKIICIDQSPIGRTPRSNPATYIGVFDLIRKLFASTPDAKMRGYSNGRFSFNVKGGRCEACSGDGVNRIEMHFLPDIYVKCDVCKGRRYNRETLEVKYKDKNIADVLDMSVDEACEFFESVPSIYRKVRTLKDVGLGYIRLGQPSTTLSGGEAQRVKLASELSKRSTGKTIYILDEPTTGLHIADVHKLVDILQRLTENKNTVVVIEHNLDVIKTCDHIIDLGPESGENGGTVIAEGTPEEVALIEKSYTGQFLKPLLKKAEKLGQYADLSAFIDTDRLELEALEIMTGPKVRRKIREDGEK